MSLKKCIIFGLMLLIAACSPSKTEAPQTVSFFVFGDPAEQDAFAAVVKAFQAKNSTVQIEFNAVPSQEDYLIRLTTDFAAGSPPDVFLVNYRRLAQYQNRGMVELLDPYIQTSEALHEADFYPIALDAFRDSQGKLVCLPQNVSSQVVYYNQDIFDAAGIPYPKADWTWADFRQTAIALTQPDTNNDGEPDQYGLGLEPQIPRLAPFIWQNGGELVDDVTAPTRLTLDTPLAMEAVHFMVNLALVDKVLPNRNAEAVQSHQARFYAGNIAMYIDSRRIVPTLREVAKFKWDVAPFPRGKEVAGILHSDAYCLAKSSTVKAAAWQFIEFALSEEGQKPASQLGRTVPSLQKVANSEFFLDPKHPPAHAQVWLEAIPTLRVLPRLENWVKIERTAGIELEQVYLGAQSPEVAIENIQQAALTDFVPLK